MNNGWIKIHRQILDWEWYDDINTFKLFMHLLIMANHKEKRYKGILIKRGQVMTGQDVLAIQTNLSRQNIRTSLERLKSTSEVTIKSNGKGSIIQVVNYENYQVVTSELTSNQPASNQQVTTNKNVKKEKNIIPPPINLIISYFSSKGIDKNEAERFNNYYTSNGWKVGRNKMTNWHASAGGWISRMDSNIKKPYKQEMK